MFQVHCEKDSSPSKFRMPWRGLLGMKRPLHCHFPTFCFSFEFTMLGTHKMRFQVHNGTFLKNSAGFSSGLVHGAWTLYGAHGGHAGLAYKKRMVMALKILKSHFLASSCQMSFEMFFEQKKVPPGWIDHVHWLYVQQMGLSLRPWAGLIGSMSLGWRPKKPWPGWLLISWGLNSVLLLKLGMNQRCFCATWKLIHHDSRSG